MSAPSPKEIREAYSDYRNEWQDIREEAAADMQAISPTGPWSEEDRAAREDAGRPCVHEDQINQYLHQYTGNLRKTKRAIQATPKGNGANDADAKKRSSLIRAIEEKSNAPTSVYIPAAESAAQRSYGFAVIRTQYKDDESFDQEIVIKPVPNPDCVLLSPYYKQPNASDVSDGFLLDWIPKKDFKRLYPKAKITDFEGEEVAFSGASDWVKQNNIVRAEYWRVEKIRKTLLLIKTPEGPLVVWEDELTNRDRGGKFKKIREGIEVIRERDVEIPRVIQYMTNGLEILDEIPWAGSRIPIIACFGPERWRTVGGRARRELLSLVRFARDPQMRVDFLSSQELELAGKIPKVPFVGAKGQFESDKEVWEELNHVPHAYVQYDAITDSTGQNLVPPPTFQSFTPDFQQWELAIDSGGRKVQAAMGITPLPTAAQRANQKSGVALEKIQDEEDIGTYAFLDNFENGFLHNMGWQINELLEPILDTQQEMPITAPDGKRSTLHVIGKTSHPIDDQGQYEVIGIPEGEDHIHTAKGDFDVTISSGPSFDSEREEQDEFVDSLIQNLANLPMPGTPQAKVLALGIRMRPTLGAIGQQIADVFDPPPAENLPPEAQALVSQLQSQIQQLTQENQALHMDRAGRLLEQQTKIHIAREKNQNTLDAKTMDFITQIVKAELAAKSKALDTQAQQDADKELTVLGFHERAQEHAHDLAMQKDQQAHEQDLAAKQAEQAQLAQATQISADQAAQQEPQGAS